MGFCSGCHCLHIRNMNTHSLVNVPHELCTIKRAGTGCPVGPLMISVLLLLWTRAACRGLWRGRYVDFLYSSACTCLCFSGNNWNCVRLCVSPLPLEGKAEFYPFPLVSSSAVRQRWRGETVEGRNEKCWVMVTDPICSSLLLLFFAWMCPASGGGRSRW